MIDVLIAGAGPNGLMLACELALAGVKPDARLGIRAEPGAEGSWGDRPRAASA